MKLRWMRFLLVLVVLGFWNSSIAQPRAVNYPNSQLSFQIKQMGVVVDGGFKKFTASINFDPGNLAAASAQIEIDMASVDTGSEEGDAEVKRRSWFDVKTHPTAKFVSTSLKKTGANTFEALGKLSIKGKSKDVVLPFTLTEDAGGSTLTGQFQLKRLEFGIGDGPWNDEEVVANALDVKYKLNLAPLKK